jgi:hypothetical protein
MCGGDQSGGAGGIRTAEPTRPALHRRDFLDARGREHDALFRACLVPDSRLLGGSPWIDTMIWLDSLSTGLKFPANWGKKQGIPRNRPISAKISSRKHLQIQ